MNHANTATYAAARPASTLSTTAIRAAASLPKPSGIRRYSLPDAHHPVPLPFELGTVRQVREEGEDYIPDRLTKHEETDPALTDVGRGHTTKARDVLGQLDDAINLVGVLLDALVAEQLRYVRDEGRRLGLSWEICLIAPCFTYRIGENIPRK